MFDDTFGFYHAIVSYVIVCVCRQLLSYSMFDDTLGLYHAVVSCDGVCVCLSPSVCVDSNSYDNWYCVCNHITERITNTSDFDFLIRTSRKV